MLFYSSGRIQSVKIQLIGQTRIIAGIISAIGKIGISVFSFQRKFDNY